MSNDLNLPAIWRPLTAVLLGSLFGGRGRTALYRRLCGYHIAKSASVGIALIIVAEADLQAGSRIGHFTIVRNLERLSLAPKARIGTFNWIFGMLPSTRYFTDEPDRLSALILEKDASLTSRHIVDCTNTVTIGAWSTVAGFYSQILTHGIDVATNRQTSAPISVGRHAMIGTRVILLKGAKVPDRAVVAAGSVFRESTEETGGLWSGVPAIRVRDLDETGAYFVRTSGHVE
jgi:acetyltransferase-like isoleucine patch superfamily enzyme